MSHCPGCYEHWSVTTPTAGDPIPLVQAHPCPGCGYEAELAMLRAVAEAAKNHCRTMNDCKRLSDALDALAAWEKGR